MDYATGGFQWSVSIGDLDGDGDADLAVANSRSSSDYVSVLLGRGDGTFVTRVDYATGNSPRSVSIGDLDGDGDADLAVANFSSNSVSVLLGRGDGTFVSRVDYPTGFNPWSVSIGDLDGDGDADLAVANISSNSVSVLLGRGDGAFVARVDYPTGTGPYSVSIGDLDGDGDADLAVANADSNSVSVLLGRGDGAFMSPADYGTGTQPVSVSIGDLDGDGDADLGVANVNSNSVSVLLGQRITPTRGNKLLSGSGVAVLFGESDSPGSHSAAAGGSVDLRRRVQQPDADLATPDLMKTLEGDRAAAAGVIRERAPSNTPTREATDLDPALAVLPGMPSRLHITTLPAVFDKAGAEAVIQPPPSDPATLARIAALLPPDSPWRLISAAPSDDDPRAFDTLAEYRGEPRRVRITLLPPGESCCDLDADGRVGLPDLQRVLAVFGSESDIDCDLNLDGVVNLTDLRTIIDGWTGAATIESATPSTP